MRPRLRVYTGDEDTVTVAPPLTSMTLGEFCRILSDACDSDRTWLRDFEGDEVQVPEDLYEVMTAYWHLRPGA